MKPECDIFISCKNLDENEKPTSDLTLAMDAYNFLSGKGLSVFYSDFTLEHLGVAAYKRAIDDALDSASVVVAVGTSVENIDSQWVRYEWDSFFNDIIKCA